MGKLVKEYLSVWLMTLVKAGSRFPEFQMKIKAA